MLRKAHPESDNLPLVADTLTINLPERNNTSKHLRAALAKNPHRDVQGLAALALAQNLQRRVKLLRRFKDEPEIAKRVEQSVGKDVAQNLRKQDPGKLTKESE